MTIANSGTFTPAGNIDATVSNANVAAGHIVCAFFATGTATVVKASGNEAARPQQ
jgi:hypothetical protein